MWSAVHSTNGNVVTKAGPYRYNIRRNANRQNASHAKLLLGYCTLDVQKRHKLIKGLPFAPSIGFVAFCVERCFVEARLHTLARAQLESLPLLDDGLELLWAEAEHGTPPDAKRVKAIIAAGDTFYNRKSRKSPFTVDVALVHAHQVLLRGLRMNEGRSNWQEVNGARQGIVQAVWYIYDDWQAAQKSELAISDGALLRLEKLGKKPFSRKAFGKVSEWRRGPLDKDYAEGRVKQQSPLDRA